MADKWVKKWQVPGSNFQMEENDMSQIRINGDWKTREVHINDEWLDPKPSQKVRNHSPDGFNWGYGGSGPAQLALAILLEFTDRETAVELYQDFKFNVIAGLPQMDFEIEINVEGWIKEYKNLFKL